MNPALRWFVVDTITGTRFDPGHDTEAAALLELVTRYAGLPCEQPDRFVVEQQAVSPWAYATALQTTR